MRIIMSTKLSAIALLILRAAFFLGHIAGVTPIRSDPWAHKGTALQINFMRTDVGVSEVVD